LAQREQPPLPAARRAGPGAPMSGVVLVTAPLRTDAGRERVALNTAYVRALARTGLVPLVVPPILDPERACAALDRVHGVVLTGGEDVDPARYGAPPHAKLGEIDVARDAVELALIAGAEPPDGEPCMLAVQWHPEDDVEGALFRGFAEAVRQPQGVARGDHSLPFA